MNQEKDSRTLPSPLTPFSSGEPAGTGPISPSIPPPVFLTRRVPPSPLEEGFPSQGPDVHTAIDASRYASAGATPRKRAIAAYLGVARDAPGTH